MMQNKTLDNDEIAECWISWCEDPLTDYLLYITWHNSVVM